MHHSRRFPLVALVIGMVLALAAIIGPVDAFPSNHAADTDLSAAPAVARDDEDDACDGDSSGSGSGGNGSGGEECDEDDDDSGQGRGRGRGRGRGGDDDEEGALAGDAAAQAEEGAIVVSIVGRSFSPDIITVQAGRAVTFVNTDDDEHTATGESFDTGVIRPGGSATVTFDAPGRFDFVCIFHAEMTGTIEVVAAGASAATPAATPATAASPAASPEAFPTATVDGDVAIEDFAFGPAEIRVAPGTTVVWTNLGQAPHTVTGDFADSGLLESGDTFRYTFAEEGTFEYVCDFHPEMQATVVVASD